MTTRIITARSMDGNFSSDQTLKRLRLVVEAYNSNEIVRDARMISCSLECVKCKVCVFTT